MNINQELFEIFVRNKRSYEKYEETSEFIKDIIEEVRTEENIKFYDFTIKLLNSINNAGWEERRSEQIEMLWNIQRVIEEKYLD